MPHFLYQLEHPEDLMTKPEQINTTTLHRYNTTCYRYMDPDDTGNSSFVTYYSRAYEIRYPCNKTIKTSDPGYSETDFPGSGEAPEGIYAETNLSDPNATFSPQEQDARKDLMHLHLSDENIAVGLMFASKAMMQLLTNPFIGPLTNK